MTDWTVVASGSFPAQQTRLVIGEDGCDLCGTPLDLDDDGALVVTIERTEETVAMFCGWECLAAHAASVCAATWEDQESREDAARAGLVVTITDEP